jgi:hypothetical protein
MTLCDASHGAVLNRTLARFMRHSAAALQARYSRPTLSEPITVGPDTAVTTSP